MFSNKIANIAAFIIISLYLFLSFFLINDYGITIDEPPAFSLGHKYLEYYKTGNINLETDNVKIENHPDFYSNYTKIYNNEIWIFTSTISAISCYIFFEKLKIIDPISAHNIIIPIINVLLFLFLFLFLKKYFNNFIALTSLLILITYPHFWGHSFNNLRDIPEIAFSTITIILFIKWFFEDKLKYLYLSFIFLGISIATKMDGLFIPIMLIFWLSKSLIISIKNNSLIKTRDLANIIIGSILALITFIICIPPMQPFFYSDFKNYLICMPKYLYKTIYFAIAIGQNISLGWNFYAPSQIFYTTPTIMLFFFLFGFFYILINLRKNKLYSLLLIWLLFPVLRHCLPKVNHYDGIRHFFIFIVPFIIIIAIGIDFITKKISDNFKIKEFFISIILALILLVPNIYALIKTHPYQTTFYNCLVGGLGGAQKKDIPFSCDYWLNSTKKAIKWLNLNGEKNSNITTGCFYNLLKFYQPNILRKDFNLFVYYKENLIKPNTYIIHIPRKLSRLDEPIYNKIEELIPEINSLKKVYTETSQDGEIFTIYYKN